MRKLAFVVLLLSLGSCGEQVDEDYATWADANLAGAVKRGWIPAFVPRSARNIKESHNLDTNAQLVEFIISPRDFPATVAGLRAVSAEDKAAAIELSRKFGLGSLLDYHVVCSDILDGILIVDTDSGRAAYKTPVAWVDDDCS